MSSKKCKVNKKLLFMKDRTKVFKKKPEPESNAESNSDTDTDSESELNITDTSSDNIISNITIQVP